MTYVCILYNVTFHNISNLSNAKLEKYISCSLISIFGSRYREYGDLKIILKSLISLSLIYASLLLFPKCLFVYLSKKSNQLNRNTEIWLKQCFMRSCTASSRTAVRSNQHSTLLGICGNPSFIRYYY